ncbi:hypothetical protein G6F52_011433 [Rhizopus delemar]|nr:hypothetical protein G6F52_011433 [Rhizopus delemar]KAG1563643.1 hypothetical protein G6F50_011804 [Rhizopus delemar]
MYQRTSLVATKPTTVEREEHSPTNTSTNYICGRQQHGMGMQSHNTTPTTPHRPWTLDAPRSTNVDQLERVESGLSSTTNISSPPQHETIDSHGQYHLHGLHEQAGRNEVTTADEASNRSMKMVLDTRDHDSVNTCTRDRQQHSRFRVQTTVSEEQLDASTTNIQSCSTTLGTKRRRPICGSEHHANKKVRIMAPRPGQSCDRRLYNSLESVSFPISQPTVESDNTMFTQDHTREIVSGDDGDALLEDRNLVSSPSGLECSTTNPPPPNHVNQTTFTISNLSNELKQQLETRRMEIISNQFNHPQLNQDAQLILTHHLTLDSSTNRSYHRGQILFLHWATFHLIPDTTFTNLQLINFLSTMYKQYNYALSTIQLFRATVTQLHQDPRSLSTDQTLNNFILRLSAQAPPIRLHRPIIDLTPTFTYLSNLNNSHYSLASLQGKLAFLLGVTCFFRPSDLHRIPASSVRLSADHRLLYLEVHNPKEKRRGRRIIKSFQVVAHNNNPTLCPVQTFISFSKRRPSCSSTALFLNSIAPNNPLQTATIQGWLSCLLRKSTSEPRVNVRSIASSLALASGIPREDVVTTSNWSNSQVFENHYRREHLSLFDFTSTLIQIEDLPGN